MSLSRTARRLLQLNFAQNIWLPHNAVRSEGWLAELINPIRLVHHHDRLAPTHFPRSYSITHWCPSHSVFIRKIHPNLFFASFFNPKTIFDSRIESRSSIEPSNTHTHSLASNWMPLIITDSIEKERKKAKTHRALSQTNLIETNRLETRSIQPCHRWRSIAHRWKDSTNFLPANGFFPLPIY